jgi:hypothetical protein
MTEPKMKTKRQADPDVQRLRDIKEAAAKWEAAKKALTLAAARESDWQKVVFGLIEDAPEPQRTYLRSLVVRAGA